jgi:hypothetical protein
MHVYLPGCRGGNYLALRKLAASTMLNPSYYVHRIVAVYNDDLIIVQRNRLKTRIPQSLFGEQGRFSVCRIVSMRHHDLFG